MNINIERLKNDAAYWDKCGAPEDATHYVDDTFTKWVNGVFTKWVNGVEFDYWEDAKEWRRAGTQYALERYMEESDEWVIIPRPTTQSQEWDGEGLPPEGVRVEVSYTPDDERWWPAGQVIAYHGDWVVFEREGKNRPLIRPYDCVRFRPTRTPEQRQRDELIKIIKEADEMAYSFRPDDLADAILSKYNLTEK